MCFDCRIQQLPAESPSSDESSEHSDSSAEPSAGSSAEPSAGSSPEPSAGSSAGQCDMQHVTSVLGIDLESQYQKLDDFASWLMKADTQKYDDAGTQVLPDSQERRHYEIMNHGRWHACAF